MGKDKKNVFASVGNPSSPYNFEENKLVKWSKKESTKNLYASLICIGLGLLAGIIVMIILILSNKGSFENIKNGIKYILGGPFTGATKSGNLKNAGNMIFYTSSLIMTGLSVGIAFKTGLFNIGAPGQYTMGTITSLLVALSINTVGNRVSGVFVWILAVLCGAVAGALWGAIPGLFKALFGTNEVIVSIMTNWIAANAATWIFSGSKYINVPETKMSFLFKASQFGNQTPTLGLDKIFPGSLVDGSIIFAIIIAVIMAIVMNKTTFGYELKACGSNRNASKYAGMNEKRNIILSMVIAGALAGIGGAFYYLNAGVEYNFASAYQTLPDYGFDGISSALLGCCSPIGIIFSSLFIKFIAQGGMKLQGVKVGLNKYISSIIVAVIIYLAGFLKLFVDVINKIQKKNGDKRAEKAQAVLETAPAGSTEEPVKENKEEAK